MATVRLQPFWCRNRIQNLLNPFKRIHLTGGKGQNQTLNRPLKRQNSQCLQANKALITHNFSLSFHRILLTVSSTLRVCFFSHLTMPLPMRHKDFTGAFTALRAAFTENRLRCVFATNRLTLPSTDVGVLFSYRNSTLTGCNSPLKSCNVSLIRFA